MSEYRHRPVPPGGKIDQDSTNTSSYTRAVALLVCGISYVAISVLLDADALGTRPYHSKVPLCFPAREIPPDIPIGVTCG